MSLKILDEIYNPYGMFNYDYTIFDRNNKWLEDIIDHETNFSKATSKNPIVDNTTQVDLVS